MSRKKRFTREFYIGVGVFVTLVLLLAFLLVSCTASIHKGALYLSVDAVRPRQEAEIWALVQEYYDVRKPVAQPKTIAGDSESVVKASSDKDDKDIRGFYRVSTNEVYYIAGAWDVLIHEYAHALNHQLLYLSPKQDEEFAQIIQENYKLKRQNSRLKRGIRE